MAIAWFLKPVVRRKIRALRRHHEVRVVRNKPIERAHWGAVGVRPRDVRAADSGREQMS